MYAGVTVVWSPGISPQRQPTSLSCTYLGPPEPLNQCSSGDIEVPKGNEKFYILTNHNSIYFITISGFYYLGANSSLLTCNYDILGIREEREFLYS